MLDEKSAASPVVIYRGPFGSAVVCKLDCEISSMFSYSIKFSRLLCPISSPIVRRFHICPLCVHGRHVLLSSVDIRNALACVAIICSDLLKLFRFLVAP